MSLGLVSGGRASRHGGGTWACGWYMKTHTDMRPPAVRLLDELPALALIDYPPGLMVVNFKKRAKPSIVAMAVLSEVACHCEPLALDNTGYPPGVFTDDLGCKSNFIVVFKNLLCKQNNNPV